MDVDNGFALARSVCQTGKESDLETDCHFINDKDTSNLPKNQKKLLITR